jgi:hypothetical protein
MSLIRLAGRKKAHVLLDLENLGFGMLRDATTTLGAPVKPAV